MHRNRFFFSDIFVFSIHPILLFDVLWTIMQFMWQTVHYKRIPTSSSILTTTFNFTFAMRCGATTPRICINMIAVLMCDYQPRLHGCFIVCIEMVHKMSTDRRRHKSTDSNVINHGIRGRRGSALTTRR